MCNQNADVTLKLQRPNGFRGNFNVPLITLIYTEELFLPDRSGGASHSSMINSMSGVIRHKKGPLLSKKSLCQAEGTLPIFLQCLPQSSFSVLFNGQGFQETLSLIAGDSG